jgi:hypothetical protein
MVWKGSGRKRWPNRALTDLNVGLFNKIVSQKMFGSDVLIIFVLTVGCITSDGPHLGLPHATLSQEQNGGYVYLLIHYWISSCC